MRVAGLIIAGGKSSRMGQPKHSVQFSGKYLINHVFDRLKNQVDRVFININDDNNNIDLGTKIIKDKTNAYQGPLAGLQAGLGQIDSQWLQIAPCDTPFLPLNLTKTLFATLKKSDKLIIVPSSGNRIHPTLGLIHESVLPLLNDFLNKGHRGFIHFIEYVGYQEVPFQDEKAFININTINELKKYEKN